MPTILESNIVNVYIKFLGIMPVILIELYEEFYMSALVTLLANIVAPLQRQFINFIRIAIYCCDGLDWGLKVCQYEADGIAHLCQIVLS